MWIIILIAVLVAAASAYVIFNKKEKPGTPAHDTYVCDVCNEKECICRKEEKNP